MYTVKQVTVIVNVSSTLTPVRNRQFNIKPMHHNVAKLLRLLTERRSPVPKTSIFFVASEACAVHFCHE